MVRGMQSPFRRTRDVIDYAADTIDRASDTVPELLDDVRAAAMMSAIAGAAIVAVCVAALFIATAAIRRA